MGFSLRPVYKEGFVNREELLKEMFSELNNLNSTVGYALFGKRRVGKTSVFKVLQERLNEIKGVVPVYFSVWDLIEWRFLEFCEKLSIEIIDAYRPYLGLKYRMKELLNTPKEVLSGILSGVEFKVIYEEIELLLSFKKGREEKIDKGKLIENLFELPERLSKKLKCVLFIDEFPSIIELKINNAKIGFPIISKIRTIFEEQKRIALCISGSIRSTMDLAILSGSSPFYRQLIVKEIKPLENKYVEELLRMNLPEISDDAINEIYDFSAGIPFYVQFIGKMLERQRIVTKESVQKVIDEFLMEEGNILFREEFESLSSKERAILIAIAKGASSPTRIAKKMEERISNVNRFLLYLSRKGYVTRQEKGIYEMEDPVFGKWIRHVLLS